MQSFATSAACPVLGHDDGVNIYILNLINNIFLNNNINSLILNDFYDIKKNIPI